MKVAFCLDTINFRGTSVAVYDYARYNQEILGNESLIIYDGSIPYEKDMGSEPSALENISKQFQVISSTKSELEKVLKNNGVDVAYFIKYGYNDFELPSSCRTAIHAVFQAKDPHGDNYAYISEWLSRKMGGDIPYVPHVVDLPAPTDSYRKKFGISDDQIVIGRYGGYYSFDLDFVKSTVIDLVEESNKFVFLFMNTQPFFKHPNIKYIDSVVDLQKKSNFINTCDAMLHARQRGESFGLSVAEFLSQNKPVVSWSGGVDLNHVDMLKGSGTLYTNSDTLEEIIKGIKDKNEEWSLRTSSFKPKHVMKKFEEVFLC